MRTKKYKIFFLFVIVLIFMTFTNYAKGTSYYYEYNSNSGSLSEYKEYINLSDLIFNIVSSQVKFTQDKEYYYFDITQNFTGSDEGYGFCLYHNYYNYTSYFIAPFSNINNVSFYNYLRFTSTGSKKENYLKLDGNIISEYDSKSSSSSFTININNCKYNFICSKYNGPKGDGSSFKYINSYNSFVNTTNFTSHIEFGIKKDNIDNFRYFRFIFPFYWDRDTSTSGNNYLYSSGVSNYSIDLKDYINCQHNFTYVEKFENMHKKICKDCKLEIEEEHECIFTYDNIENNQCICGYNKIVRFILLDEKDEIIFELSGSPNDFLDYIDDKNKLGVDFLYYETYILNGDLWVKDEDYTEIIKNLKNESVKFIKKVKIHKYHLSFNKENSLNLSVNGDMDTQTIFCGESVSIKKCDFFVLGYSFAGWGIKPNIDEVMFLDEESIIDLSYEDNKNINLYPIFSPLTFNVKYHYKENNLIKLKNYTYDNIENLEEFNINLDNERTFVGWEFDGVILINENTKIFNSYVEKNIKNFNLYAYIKTPLNGGERTKNTENSPNKKIILDNENNISIDENSINKNKLSKNINEDISDKKDMNFDIKNNIENLILKILKINDLLDYEVLDKKILKNDISENEKELSIEKDNGLFFTKFKLFKKITNVEIIYILRIIFYLLIFTLIYFIVFFVILLIKLLIDKDKK